MYSAASWKSPIRVCACWCPCRGGCCPESPQRTLVWWSPSASNVRVNAFCNVALLEAKAAGFGVWKQCVGHPLAFLPACAVGQQSLSHSPFVSAPACLLLPGSTQSSTSYWTTSRTELEGSEGKLRFCSIARQLELAVISRQDVAS